MNQPRVYTCLFLFMYFGVSSLKKKKKIYDILLVIHASSGTWKQSMLKINK